MVDALHCNQHLWLVHGDLQVNGDAMSATTPDKSRMSPRRHSSGFSNRNPIGSESPSIWPCSSCSSSDTSSTMRTQCSGTLWPRSADSTLRRWLSSTSRACWPVRRARR